MILPNKYIKLSESLFGFGAFIVSYLEEPKSIDDLWAYYNEAFDNKTFLAKHSFENMILAIDLLHIMGAINVDSSGRIYSCNS